MPKKTISEWRANERYVQMAAKVVATEEWKAMRECLAHNTPSEQIKPESSAQHMGLALGMSRGWQRCLDAIELLAELDQSAKKQIKSTYGVETKDQ